MLRLVLLLTLLLPATASAMDIGMQDDLVIVRGASTVKGVASRPLALQQFKDMGGTIVRMNLEHTRGSGTQDDTSPKRVYGTTLAMYDQAVDAVRAEGLKVHLTLLWRTQSSHRLAIWMGRLAKHFGKRVQRYSIFNEPDLLIDRTCGPKSKAFFIHKFPHRVDYIPNRQPRPKVLTPEGNMNLTTACLRYKRGLLYAHFVHDAADQIHRANPKAQVLAGETSAQPGLEWFVRGARPRRMDVDGWAHHPFQLHDLTPGRPANGWGVGNIKLIKKLIPLPLYFTEFGYPHPHSSMDKRAFGRRLRPAEVAKAYVKAWRIVERSGAREMLQYQWFRKPSWAPGYWETSLLERPDGKLTPAYRGLRKLIASFREDDYSATRRR